jgi:hypothetical protein
MQENTDRNLGRTSEDILNECMVISALDSTSWRSKAGPARQQIIISCKVSRPRDSDRDLPRARPADRAAAAPRTHRKPGMGHERSRLVRVGDGRSCSTKGSATRFVCR